MTHLYFFWLTFFCDQQRLMHLAQAPSKAETARCLHSPLFTPSIPGPEGSPEKPGSEQHKTLLLFCFSLNALGSRHFILCTPRSITAQPNKDFCHSDSFSSSELFSPLLIRLPTLLSVNELMRTLYFRLVETKRATAQLQSLRGRFSIFKAWPRHLKGLKIKLVSLAGNKKLEAGLLHSPCFFFKSFQSPVKTVF